MRPANPIVDAFFARLNADDTEAFEERAGILQFEAGHERELAEALAMLEVIRLQPLAGSGYVVLQLTGQTAPVFVLADTQTTGQPNAGGYAAQEAQVVPLSRALASLGGTARLTASEPSAEK